MNKFNQGQQFFDDLEQVLAKDGYELISYSIGGDLGDNAIMIRYRKKEIEDG